MTARPIDKDTPRDRPILVYNPVTNWYRSQFFDNGWPLHGLDNMPGIWYPEPSHWMELPNSPAEEDTTK